MPASKLKLEIEQGATFRRRVTWKTGAAQTPVDLTGWTAKMQVRAKIGAPTVLVELSTENDMIALGGAAGTIDLYIPASTTETFEWTAGTYDLEMMAPGVDGDIIRLLYGSVTVSQEVTK